jgi:hypothetical protein
MPDFAPHPCRGKLTFKRVYSDLATLDQVLRLMGPGACGEEEEHGF